MTLTTITMRINLAGEVVELLLLLPQSVLQVLLLLLQPGHLVIMIIKLKVSRSYFGFWIHSLDEYLRDALREKRDYVEKIPKLGGGSDPNPLVDVYLPSYFWHAKMILRC